MNRTNIRKRIIHNNILGDVLAEGRTCYFVRFPWGCKFLNKQEIVPVRETKEAFLKDVISHSLNA